MTAAIIAISLTQFLARARIRPIITASDVRSYISLAISASLVKPLPDKGNAMRLGWDEIKRRAKMFSEEWQDAYYEKGQTQTFYNEFFELSGSSASRWRSTTAGEVAFEKPRLH